MNLNSDYSMLGNVWLLLIVVSRLQAVDPDRDSRPFRPNDVVVPVIPAQDFVDCNHVGRDQHAISPRLVINRAPPIRIAQVALITCDFGRIGNALAADLHAAVDEPTGPGKPESQAQNEIRERTRRAKEIVLLDRLLERAANDGTILHTPELRVSFPAIQRSAVK